jgi:hypothetical protein
MKVQRIVSGGQTGADRGGLDAAMACGVAHGGWCPLGRLAEDGRVPARYRLREMPTAVYAARTEQNVLDADATVVFTFGPPAGGSLSTVDFARLHGRPCLHIDLEKAGDPEAAAAVRAWLEGLSGDAAPGHAPVVNVAGSRESQAPGIHARVHAVMRAALGG